MFSGGIEVEHWLKVGSTLIGFTSDWVVSTSAIFLFLFRTENRNQKGEVKCFIVYMSRLFGTFRRFR